MGAWGTKWMMARFLVLLWVVAASLGDFRATGFVGDSSLLDCGYKSLQLTLPRSQGENDLKLVVLDKEEKPYPLRNDSVCGTWVGHKPDGSLTIVAAYNGCYVVEQNGEYIMTVGIADLTGQNVILQETLSCPTLPAQDAPSPGTCAAVKRKERLSCSSQPVIKDTCQGKGCCYNPSDKSLPCYYGDLITAQCTKDGTISIAISKDVTLPPLLLDSVRLLSVQEGTCSDLIMKKSGVFIMYQFPLSCGTTIWMPSCGRGTFKKENIILHLNTASDVFKCLMSPLYVPRLHGDQTIYENRLEAAKDVQTWKNASITRDSTFRLTVRCSFNASSFLPLQVEVFTLPPPPSVNSSGPLLLEMRIAKDGQYGSYYLASDYPVVKLLRDPVYLEVRIRQRTDPNLVLVLNQCWANPFTAPLQKPQWPILLNSCPFAGDNYQTQQIPVDAASTKLQFPSHYQHFVVKTFTFVNGSQHALKGLVYFHCSASVCARSSLENCSTTCLPARKKRMTDWDPANNLVTADGPVDFHSSNELEHLPMAKAGTPRIDQSMLDWVRGAMATVGVLGVVFAAVALWKFNKEQKCETDVVKV